MSRTPWRVDRYRHHGAAFWAHWVLAAALLWFSSSRAIAQPTTLADTGMPGVQAVALLVDRTPDYGVALGASYGFTDAALQQGDRHHRVAMRIAGAYAPIPELNIGLQLAGRYDGHRMGDGSTDSGLIARPMLVARAKFNLGTNLRAGAQLGLQPGPTFALDTAVSGAAINLDALLAGQSGALTLTGLVGLRLDGGKNAIANLSTLSDNDRLALGIGAAPEVRLGAAGHYALSSTAALVAEATWDVPVGRHAIPALAAPIWLRLGGRLAVSERWQLGAMIGASPSRRDGSAVTDNLVRVDPRLFAGISVGFSSGSSNRNTGSLDQTPAAKAAPSPTTFTVTGFGDQPVAQARVRSGELECTTGASGRCRLVVEDNAATVTATGYATAKTSVAQDARPVQVQLSPTPITLTGTVLDASGQPVARARVSVMRGDRQRDVEADAAGAFTIAGLAPGAIVIRVEAEGLPASERSLELKPNQEPVALSPQNQASTGQIRGTVRTFGGQAVQATIRVSPGATELRCDRDGTFRLDLVPGTYEVTVQATGYQAQHRQAIVEAGGVAVLLVELRAQP